jgi:hypothetical protein
VKSTVQVDNPSGDESNTQHALPDDGKWRKRTRRFGVMSVNKVIVIGNFGS